MERASGRESKKSLGSKSSWRILCGFTVVVNMILLKFCLSMVFLFARFVSKFCLDPMFERYSMEKHIKYLRSEDLILWLFCSELRVHLLINVCI